MFPFVYQQSLINKRLSLFFLSLFLSDAMQVEITREVNSKEVVVDGSRDTNHTKQ